MITEPPLLPGGVNVIVACPLPETAMMFVGASGALNGVTELLGLDEILSPISFVATTVNVYAVPFERPVTVIGEDPPVALNPPTLEVTV